MKESWPSKRQRLHDKKQTSTPATDNKRNKESSAGGTKLTWREGGRTVDLGMLAEQTCFSEDIWKATSEKTTRASAFRLNSQVLRFHFHGKENY